MKHASRRNQLETLKDLKKKYLENPENELGRVRTHEAFTPDIGLFIHAQDARWFVISYLIKELLIENFSKEVLQFFKFLRIPANVQTAISNFERLEDNKVNS